MKILNLLILICLIFGSCTKPTKSDIQHVSIDNADSTITGVLQANQRIGVWDEVDKKRDIRIVSYYGYSKDTSLKARASYYYHNTLVMDVFFQNGFIEDVDLKEPGSVSKVDPFLDNNLGSGLFYMNCYNCHAWNYNYESAFAKLLKRKHENGSLIKFIKEGQRPNENDALLLQHPEMYHLDTFEINAIVKFVTIMDTSVVAGK